MLGKAAADRFGIGFDGQDMFTLWASLDRVEGAIAAVSNASVQAASLAILRAEEDRNRRRNSEVYDRVRDVFGPAVEKMAELEGRHAKWTAHNVVSLPDRRFAIFEFVSNHQNSIPSKFMMFSDIALREEKNISLNAVVRNVDELGHKGLMLHDVATLISLTASNDDYRRYAQVG
jgi:hypothetical protein